MISKNPKKWSDWNKLHINETVLLWKNSLHSIRYCSHSGEICLGEVFIVSNECFKQIEDFSNSFVKKCSKNVKNWLVLSIVN